MDNNQIQWLAIGIVAVAGLLNTTLLWIVSINKNQTNWRNKR